MTSWLWLLTPLMASLLMALCLVPLGHRVLERGVVFADLAIAQWAALGSLAGQSLMPNHTIAGMPVSGLLSALLAVAMVHLILKLVPDYREAMIGTLYVLGASLATLVVSQDPHGAQQLAKTLNGDLLWVTTISLLPLAAITLAVLLWHNTGSERFRSRLFLPLFAVAVTLTVDLAGVYVVFATLIAAPLMLCCLRGYSQLMASALCFAGHSVGLWLSASHDIPAGPAVVVSVLGSCLLALLVFRKPARRDTSPARYKHG
ncbi:metal ABC transporter permease [Marinobacter sp. HL-58]|uniref:metal ABC transporter permease n=1 Tax=Marinobacter sp. HL-58 TaxID=1479237 RepID=UPI000689A680|nr:metal ABC transporter permease [Marinobacter sp. HL-58]KPQ00213.1 MAG: ABC-type transport system permease component [Marinobacter sp. HL-58]